MTERDQIAIGPDSLGSRTIDQFMVALELDHLCPDVRDATPADCVDWGDTILYVVEIDAPDQIPLLMIVDRALERHYPVSKFDFGTNWGMW